MIEVDPRVLKKAAARKVQYWVDVVAEEKVKLAARLEEQDADAKAEHWLRRWFWPKADPWFDSTYFDFDYESALDVLQKALEQERRVVEVCDVAIATNQLVWLPEKWSDLLPSINYILHSETPTLK